MCPDYVDLTRYGVGAWTPCGIRMHPERDSAHPN